MDEILFRNRCVELIDSIQQKSQGRQIWIYGAGRGGDILLDVLMNADINISGFVDRNSKSIQRKYGFPVVTIDGLVTEQIYLIISLMSVDVPLIRRCVASGFGDNMCVVALWNSLDWSEEDLEYKGCEIGRYTYGYRSFLEYNLQNVKSIGRFCSINVTARAVANHPYEFVSVNPFFYEPTVDTSQEIFAFPTGLDYFKMDKLIVIENDVWIGINAVICPNVKIGNGAVIGAGAVVTHDVEPYSIVGGVPARHIKYRFPGHICKKLNEIAWWDWSMEKIKENFEHFSSPEEFVDRFI